jgi:hypothetical protein
MNISTWLPTLALLAVIFGIKFIADLLEKRPVDTSKLPFIKKVDTLTNSEKFFFRFLENLPVVKENYYVFPQLSISKLVTLPDNLKRNWALINKIDRKSVDFVLFDKSTLNPVIAIELDGSSHNSFSRQERDSFVDQVFSTAGVPLIHVRRNDTGYNVEEITNRISSCLNNP